MVGQSRRCKLWRGDVWCVWPGLGSQGFAGHVTVERGEAGQSTVGQGSRGLARRGEVQYVAANHGMAGRVKAVTARATHTNQKGGKMPAFTNKYSYRRGFNFKVSAQVVGETLEELAQTGELTSARFLDVSRPEDAPTHNLFEWNDSVAAERYRLQQATVAINSVEVQIVNESTATAISQAAFVNVISKAPARTGEFTPIDVALSDANMRNALLQNALKELQSFRRKYSQLNELTAVFAEIKKVEQAS